MQALGFLRGLLVLWGMTCCLVQLCEESCSTKTSPAIGVDAAENRHFWGRFWGTYNFVGEPRALAGTHVDGVLKKHWRRLCPVEADVSSILIPLAGTGDEMEFLLSLCSVEAVFGVEIDLLPIAVFYQRLLGTINASSSFIAAKPEAVVPAQVARRHLPRGRALYGHEPGLHFVHADFLAVEPQDFLLTMGGPGDGEAGKAPVAEQLAAPFDSIFDRRAFSAISPSLRRPYVAKLTQLSKPGTRMLITVLLKGDGDGANGALEERSVPPFAITEVELFGLFASAWSGIDEPLPSDIRTRHGIERTYLMTRRGAV